MLVLDLGSNKKWAMNFWFKENSLGYDSSAKINRMTVPLLEVRGNSAEPCLSDLSNANQLLTARVTCLFVFALSP